MGNSKTKTAEITGDTPTTAPTAAPDVKKASSSRSSGAYLIFSTETGGLLTLQWSDTSIGGALAFFSPKKSVPEHKKTQNAGRMELIRGIASNKHKMLEGAILFVKEAITWDSDIKFLDDQYFELWYCQGTAVKPLRVSDTVAVSKFDALAVMPHGNTSFKGVQKLDVGRFVNTATREGAAWKH